MEDAKKKKTAQITYIVYPALSTYYLQVIV